MDNARIILSTNLDPLLLEADGQGITCVHFLRNEKSFSSLGFLREGKGLPEKDVANLFPPREAFNHLLKAMLWLNAYFSRQPLPPMPAIHLRGTPFQMRVWNALRSIPYGHTTTYGTIARQIGKPKATQAVGQAVGANPVAIIVPCHRVLGAHCLGGYAYGLEAKCSLLAIEGCVLL